MSVKQWVQHFSGKGEKWKVQDFGGTWQELGRVVSIEYPHLWRVVDHQGTTPGGGYAWLPKSEYIPCDPPEQWEDVTHECHTVEVDAAIPLRFQGGIADSRGMILFEKNKLHGMDYRLRKVQLRTLDSDPVLGHQLVWAFIVERRKS